MNIITNIINAVNADIIAVAALVAFVGIALVVAADFEAPSRG